MTTSNTGHISRSDITLDRVGDNLLEPSDDDLDIYRSHDLMTLSASLLMSMPDLSLWTPMISI